jgi:hypothetical protein
MTIGREKTTDRETLPVPVFDYPHWRVTIRPADYTPELIPNLCDCFDTVEKCKVSLRGWDYPHLSRRQSERGQGDNWVASWSTFMGHVEYWRLYQSGQFLNLFAVREFSEKEFGDHLRQVSASHFRGVDLAKVPGFISITNFLYTMTEIFEFAARLCQSGPLGGTIVIGIALKDIRGFALTTDWDRAWFNLYQASQDVLKKEWTIPSDSLMSKSASHSLEAVRWFFERFGWLDPSMAILQTDQQTFIRKRS